MTNKIAVTVKSFVEMRRPTGAQILKEGNPPSGLSHQSSTEEPVLKTGFPSQATGVGDPPESAGSSLPSPFIFGMTDH